MAHILRGTSQIDFSEVISLAAMASVPDEISSTVVEAIERFAHSQSIKLTGEDCDVADLEWAYLKCLDPIKELADICSGSNLNCKMAYKEGRLYAAIAPVLFSESEYDEADDSLLAALLIHHLDELLLAVRAGNVSRQLHLTTDLIELQQRISERSHTRANSALAIKRANLRHKKTNELKAETIEDWKLHHDAYKSKSDYAKVNCFLIKVKWRTILGWITEYERGEWDDEE